MNARLIRNKHGVVDGLLIDDIIFNMIQVMKIPALHEVYHSLLNKKTVEQGKEQWKHLKNS